MSLDAGRLPGWLDNAFPDRAGSSPTSVTLLAEGWESDVYLIDFGGPLVVRRYAGAGAAATSRREFDALLRLGQAGYPVPHVYAVEGDPRVLGRPFLVMEWVDSDGGRPWSALDDPAAMAQFVGLFHRLHTLDWRPFAEPADHEELAAGRGVERTLAGWRRIMAAHPVEGFAGVIEWLAERLPTLPRRAPAVVHLDFHPGNVLQTAEGPRVVDWTGVAVADPRFDVAWTQLLRATATPTYRPDGRLRAAYQQVAGPLAGMMFFEVAAILRRLYSIVASLAAGPEAFGMRAEAAHLMRAQVPTLEGPYRAMREATGVTVPEVEALLAGR